MRQVTVREMRELLPEIEATLQAEGELVLTRRGKPVARLIPLLDNRSRRASHAAFRARTRPQDTPSEALVREDRDTRG